MHCFTLPLLFLFVALGAATRMGKVDQLQRICGDKLQLKYHIGQGRFPTYYFATATMRGDILETRLEESIPSEGEYRWGQDCNEDGTMLFTRLSLLDPPEVRAYSTKTFETLYSVVADDRMRLLKSSKSDILVAYSQGHPIIAFQIFSHDLTLLHEWELDVTGLRCAIPHTTFVNGISTLEVDEANNNDLIIAYEYIDVTMTKFYCMDRYSLTGEYLDKVELPIIDGNFVLTSTAYVLKTESGLAAYSRVAPYELLWSKNKYGSHLMTGGGKYVVLSSEEDSITVLSAGTGKIKYRWGEDSSFSRSFSKIIGIGVKSNGDIIMADKKKQQVVQFSPDGKIKSKLNFDSKINYFALNPAQDQFFLKFSGTARQVHLFAKDGTQLEQFRVRGRHGMAAAASGKLVVYDQTDEKLYRYSASRKLLKTTGSEPVQLDAFAISPDEAVYYVESSMRFVYVLSPKLVPTFSWGETYPLLQTDMNAITVDSSNRVYAINLRHNLVYAFTSNGEYIFTFGEGVLTNPLLIAVTPKIPGKKRFIYVVDGDQVLKFSYGGKYLTRWFS